MRVQEDIVLNIPSASGRSRALVVMSAPGVYRVEVDRWTEEWVPGYGKVAEFWEPLHHGPTYADTSDRAVELAHELLKAYPD